MAISSAAGGRLDGRAELRRNPREFRARNACGRLVSSVRRCPAGLISGDSYSAKAIPRRERVPLSSR